MTTTTSAPTSLTAISTAQFIVPCLARGIGFAEKLLTDIPEDAFARCAVKGASHPAFIIGHLCLYPNKVFRLIGRTELIVERPEWEKLFQAGATCADDPSLYPTKAELIKAFNDGWNKVLEVLPSVSDRVLALDNPVEGRFREIFPKVGTAVMFLCTSHLMMHLGQISTFRRAIGLGSAM